MGPKISAEDLQKWADFLLNYSLDGISNDDIIMIKGEKICWPLMSVLQDKIIKAGAIADINITPPDNDRGKIWGAEMAKNGSMRQIERIPDWYIKRYENMTKYIEILGAENPQAFEGTNPELARAIMKADEQIKNIRLAKPWVLTLFPTAGFAKIEGMTLEEYTNVIVSASTVDPRLLEDVEEDIYNLMDKSSEIKIVTENPKTGKLLTLKMNIADKNIIKCTGKRNFPDGEVYTSPDANTVEGEIYVDLPIFQGGTTIRGIYLKFESGNIIEYSAEKGGDTLSKIIETDKGSHKVGEVALGMNNGISKALTHPLFVEKMGGTLHIAIGASYVNCYVDDASSEEGKKILDDLHKKGILNRSAQHVDIVTDFREGGAGREVYLDNVKIEIKDNIWVIP
ncbi:MAG: aminopeptidase [Melioribacteraceae bacterium]|nr:aminopeptidase [Melioribacteraceae bacterium]